MILLRIPLHFMVALLLSEDVLHVGCGLDVRVSFSVLVNLQSLV